MPASDGFFGTVAVIVRSPVRMRDGGRAGDASARPHPLDRPPDRR